MSIPAQFQSFRIHNDADGYRSGIEPISLDNLAPGEVVIKTAYSSVNYKDALAGTGQGKILRKFPLVGGIDVAGHVIASTDPKFREGDAVLVTGCGLSETRDGGYSEYARLESQWVIPLPDGLSLRESMILGTAGFTAALAPLGNLVRTDAKGFALRTDRVTSADQPHLYFVGHSYDSTGGLYNIKRDSALAAERIAAGTRGVAA